MIESCWDEVSCELGLESATQTEDSKWPGVVPGSFVFFPFRKVCLWAVRAVSGSWLCLLPFTCQL